MLGVVAWLATRDDDSTAGVSETVRVVTPAELSEAAKGLEQPVYWAGPIAGAKIELVEFAEGVQVRYAKGGSAPAESLTIGSYPLSDPAASLDQAAEEPGAVRREGPSGDLVVNENDPSSVYFASADNQVQVEVYDPSPARALALARSGRVQPVP